MACGAANGEMDEGKRLVKEVLQGAREAADDDIPVGEEFKAEDDEDDGDIGEAMELGENDGQSTGKDKNTSAARKRTSRRS